MDYFGLLSFLETFALPFIDELRDGMKDLGVGWAPEAATEDQYCLDLIDSIDAIDAIAAIAAIDSIDAMEGR